MNAQTVAEPVSIALVGMSGVMQNAHIPNLMDLRVDGRPGLTYCVLQAIYEYQICVKVREMKASS